MCRVQHDHQRSSGPSPIGISSWARSVYFRMISRDVSTFKIYGDTTIVKPINILPSRVQTDPFLQQQHPFLSRLSLFPLPLHPAHEQSDEYSWNLMKYVIDFNS
jgi:hypothetical protein